jgi:hypothetical protein
MMDRDSLMAPLSPRLLLEIDLNVRRPEQYRRIRDDIPGHKLGEFQRRSIANTFKEIIFHDPQILEQWHRPIMPQLGSQPYITLRQPDSA